MNNGSTDQVAGCDVDAVVAQIEAGVASRDTVMNAVAQLTRSGKPIPLPVELAALKFYIAEDPTRIDLKRRLVTVARLLGGKVDEALFAEVKDSLVSEEYQTDFQTMLDQYAKQVRFADVEPEFLAMVDKVRRYTMTSVERLYALWSSVGYVCKAPVPGDIVECGVWRGGSVMMIALELLRLGVSDRDLWLYDTFAGLPRPDPALDVDILGNRAIDGWQATTLTDGRTYWAYADQKDVRRNVGSTGYPADRQHFVAGLVEETIPRVVPDRIALLRIDTDWYASYRHVLRELYQHVVPAGVIIFDDYGHFVGARKAVDEFRAENNIAAPLIRVDYSCRLMIKLPENS